MPPPATFRPNHLPVCLLALPILVGFLFFLGFGFHGGNSPLPSGLALLYLPCLLLGGFVIGLVELTGLRASPLNFLLLVLGAIPICLLYAYLLYLPFRLFAEGRHDARRRVPTLVCGLFLLGLYLFLAVRFAWHLHTAAHPSPETLARREAHQIANLLTLYTRTRSLPGGAPAELPAVLAINRHRHGTFLQIDPARLSPDSTHYLDPWGTPYRFGGFPDKSGWTYSSGPNRLDEGGRADDISSWAPR